MCRQVESPIVFISTWAPSISRLGDAGGRHTSDTIIPSPPSPSLVLHITQYQLGGDPSQDMNPSRDGGHHQKQQDYLGEETKRSNDRKPERRFPWTLHRLLEEAEQENNQDVVAWMPSGNAFIVHKRDIFMKELLPRYFRQTKFKSFVRQLNLWGFTFIDRGADKGSYFNEHFVKGKPWLCYSMRRLKLKGGNTASFPSPERGSSRLGGSSGGPEGSPESSSLLQTLAAGSSSMAAISGGGAATSLSMLSPRVQQPSSSIEAGASAVARQQRSASDLLGHRSQSPTLSSTITMPAGQHPDRQFAQTSSNQIQGLAMPTRYAGPLLFDSPYQHPSPFFRHQLQHQVIPDPNFLHMNRGNTGHPSEILPSLRESLSTRGTTSAGWSAFGTPGNTTNTMRAPNVSNRGDWLDRLEAVLSPIPDVPGPPDVGSSSTGGGVSMGHQQQLQQQLQQQQLQQQQLQQHSSINVTSPPTTLRESWPTISDLEPRPFRSSEDGSKKKPPPPAGQVGRPKQGGGGHEEETKDYGLDPRRWNVDSSNRSLGHSMGPKAPPPS